MPWTIEYPIEPEAAQWLTALWIKEWGGLSMISQGRAHHLPELHQMAIRDDRSYVGAITWAHQDTVVEVVSLNATQEGAGVGSALLRSMEAIVWQNGVQTIFVVTTNDNLRALALYQKRGYALKNLYPDAVTKARQEKPEIPWIAPNGIPIRDEIVLEKSCRTINEAE